MTATQVNVGDVAELVARLQVLEDRAALDDLIKRYAIGCDTRDRALLLDVFTPDARGTYAAAEPMVGAETIVDWISMMTEPTIWQQHVVSPYTYEIEGDRAAVTAYLISHQNYQANPNVVTMMTSRYAFACERTATGWRIAELTLVVGWIESRYGDQSQLG